VKYSTKHEEKWIDINKLLKSLKGYKKQTSERTITDVINRVLPVLRALISPPQNIPRN